MYKLLDYMHKWAYNVMMPRVLLIRRLAFFVHTAEHNPPLVHVYFGTPENHRAWAKIQIYGQATVMGAENFTARDLDQIVRICQGRIKYLSSKWRKSNGKRLQQKP